MYIYITFALIIMVVDTCRIRIKKRSYAGLDTNLETWKALAC